MRRAWAALPCVLFLSCGFEPSVLDGKKVEDGYGFVVALYDGDRYFKCAGTAIGNGESVGTKYVLTAAHCKPSKSFTIRYGDVDRTSSTARKVNIEKIYKYSKPYDHAVREHDLVLVRLESEVDASVALSKAGEKWESGTVVGWGPIECNGGYVSVLHEANVSNIDLSRCKKSWGKPGLPNTVVCGGKEKGGGVCVGDSGGPLLSESGDSLIGITSGTGGGSRCCGKKPSIFTDLSNSEYRNWILDVLNGEKE